MFERIKGWVRGVGRALGLIDNINKLREHKNINADELEYDRIDFNKRLYGGYVQEWHDLEYQGTIEKIKRKQRTLNMPKVLAKKLAKLTFNEGVQISIGEDTGKEAQWDLIKDVVTSNRFIREFQRYLEYMFAMGGVAVEVYLDGDEPKIAYATADAFFALSQDTEQVDEAVIANQEKVDGRYYTLLKWHEWGEFENGHNYKITNELYESGNKDVIGDKVRLSKLYDDMEPVSLFTLEHPLFVYFKPNEANNKNITSPLGISVFENCQDTIRMLDVMYDFWWNEFRLGKRRVAVPEYLVKTQFNAQGKPYVTFDDSEELFVALNSAEMDDMEMKDLTVDLRVGQIVESIQSLLDVLAMQVGLSPGTFTFQSGGVKTATQVVAENSETFQTRSSHLSIIEDGLRDLIMSIYEVATLDMQVSDPLERSDISIDFNDGVFDDNQSRLNYWRDGYKAGLVPREKAIERAFNLSSEEAREWAEQLQADTQQNVFSRQQAAAQAELGIER